MMATDRVPITETAHLAGRGPFGALSDENGYCDVRWDHGFGFHVSRPEPEGEDIDVWDTPFHKVTGDLFRSLRHSPVWCRPRYFTWQLPLPLYPLFLYSPPI